MIRSSFVAVLAFAVFVLPIKGQETESAQVTMAIEVPEVPTDLLASLTAEADSLAADSTSVEEQGGEGQDGEATDGASEDQAPDSLESGLGLEGDSLDASGAAQAALDLLVRASRTDSDLPANVVALMIRDALVQPHNEELWTQIQATIAEVYGTDVLASIVPGAATDGTQTAEGDLIEDTADEGLLEAAATEILANQTTASEGESEAAAIQPTPLEGAETGTAENAETPSSTSLSDWTKDDVVLMLKNAQAATSERLGAAALIIREQSIAVRQWLGINDISLVRAPWVLIGLVAVLWGLRALVRTTRTAAAGVSAATSGAYRKAVRSARRMNKKGASTPQVARKTGLPQEAIQVLDLLRRRDEKRKAQKAKSSRGKKEVA